ncbi:MAG: DUF488 family protein [Firmicutes bacterium]|nr:DUF488 family protein [Bacillota bacterium]
MFVPISIGRVYDAAEAAEMRILVDRLWPRGVSKTRRLWDLWIPDVAPSTALRRWYGHVPDRWEEFCRRYREELEQQRGTPALAELIRLVDQQPVRLLTATKDVQQSHLPVLQECLERWSRGEVAPLPPC